MTHPHHLHAEAALWSLRAARRHLHDRADYTGANIHIDPTATLRSPRYGTRTGSGGHSDPVGSALDAATRYADRYDGLAERTTGTLAWLARGIRAAGPGDPLGRIHDALPGLQPAAAAQLHLWLAELDERIRQDLDMQPARQALVGAACPSCGVRRLEAQTAAPDRACWTVICAAGCRCAGDACTCRMAMTLEGVAHIWPATSTLAKPLISTLGTTGRSAA